MKFLDIARQILAKTSPEDVARGVRGPWNYQSKLPSLMWDVSDDRVYALRANNPAKEKKYSNPGPEALAILGLSLLPSVRRCERDAHGKDAWGLGRTVRFLGLSGESRPHPMPSGP